jgi:hypothetical protein
MGRRKSFQVGAAKNNGQCAFYGIAGAGCAASHPRFSLPLQGTFSKGRLTRTLREHIMIFT